MNEEKVISVNPVDRSLIQIIDAAGYSGYGKAVTAEIERLQTKIEALRTQNQELMAALKTIYVFPVHSELVGVVMELQAIAHNALTALALKP